MQDRIAERLGGLQFGRSTKIYKFELIKRAKAQAMKDDPSLPLIDMGVGEPDWAADAGVVEALSKEAGKPENRWYSDNGIPEFQDAAAKYMERVYGVKDLDPRTQIIHGIGSKPILAMLPACFINPGDITLQTVPGYPVMATHTRYLGGEVVDLPLTQANGFLPDLDAIPANVLARAKLLYLNYPNNPTGAVATRAFFEKVVAFAKQHKLVVVHDAAYGALVYDGLKPLSFLSIPGAMDVGVEVHSLSKAFNMTGWRMAFIAGNATAVAAYGTVKDNSDSGQFRGIQKAGIHALEHTDITDRTCAKYARRHAMLAKTLCDLGFKAKKPSATFYFYVPCPKGAADGTVFATASDFSQYLIHKAHVSTVPWDDVGAFVRFSVTFTAKDEAEEQKVMAELTRRISGLGLKF